jgi:hypothetical protein
MTFTADKVLLALLKRGVEALESVAKDVHIIKFIQSRPGQITLILMEKKNMAILFKVILPTEVTPDVVNRVLSVQVGDLPAVVQDVAVDAVEVDGFSGELNAPVKLSLVDVDGAGNTSDASTLDAVLLDVFAPAKPGELGIVETAQV